MNDSPATRTLTYRELADALRISLRAAEARARRRVRQGNWRPFKGNDGIARFVVPVADLQADRTFTQGATRDPTQGDTVGAAQRDTHSHAPVVASSVLAELATRVGRAEAERDAARAERQRVEAERDQARAELVGLHHRLGRAEADRDIAQADQERTKREAAKAQAELAEWTSGSPLARAIRALLYWR